MDLSAYFARIGYNGAAKPDLATLATLHRLHANAIAFENLDVQLGRTLTTNIAAAFDKLVSRRRGGWCYEQNGLLGWALQESGFEVTRASAGVMRETGGDAQLDNHLCLLVHLNEDIWLADVGFGGSLAEPLRLATRQRREAPYDLGLRRQSDGYWRFWETEGGDPFSFDFRVEPADEARLSARCAALQTDPASPFVQNLVVQQRQGDSHLSLRGRVLTETGTTNKRTLQTADALIDVLGTQFGLNVPEAAALWPAICARHEKLNLPGA